MGRKPCCSKEDGLNKGAWTAIEDQILIDYINARGEGKWRSLPKAAGLKRCGKSCRLRWLNYLRPGIKRGNITSDEEDLIIKLHKLLGNRWSLIAGRLPGRTDNEIKNYWNTVLSKRAQVKELDRTIKYGKKQKVVISWSRKAPTGSGSGSGGVIHAKAKRCTTKVFINPQQQMITAKDDDNLVRTSPSIDAKLVNETAAVESESSDGFKEEKPPSKLITGSGNEEKSNISEALLASDDFKQLRDFDLCDMNTTGICEYRTTNDCGQALWSPLGMVENWSVNDFVELEANLDSDFGFVATFLDQPTQDQLII